MVLKTAWVTVRCSHLFSLKARSSAHVPVRGIP